MKKLTMTIAVALSLAACGTPNKTNIRSKENVDCKRGETMVCRDGYASRLEKNEPDAGEFCRCQPSDVGIDQL
jgi:hypothetical protein